MSMTLKDTLVAFGEFLDARNECYVREHPDKDTEEETHEEVAQAFLKWWAEVPERAALPDSIPDKIVVRVMEGVFAEDDIIIATQSGNGNWYGRNVRMEDLA